jgi:hypothetical protein
VTASDQHVVTAPRHVDDIIGDEAMAALDQIEHAFALADPRAAAKQQTDAEDVGQRAVDVRARAKASSRNGFKRR